MDIAARTRVLTCACYPFPQACYNGDGSHSIPDASTGGQAGSCIYSPVMPYANGTSYASGANSGGYQCVVCPPAPQLPIAAGAAWPIYGSASFVFGTAFTKFPPGPALASTTAVRGPVQCAGFPTTYSVSGYGAAGLACFDGNSGAACAPGNVSCPCVYPSAAPFNGAYTTAKNPGSSAIVCPAQGLQRAGCPLTPGACISGGTTSGTFGQIISAANTAGPLCLDTKGGSLVLSACQNTAATQQWLLRSDKLIYNAGSASCLTVTSSFLTPNGLTVSACNAANLGQVFNIQALASFPAWFQTSKGCVDTMVIAPLAGAAVKAPPVCSPNRNAFWSFKPLNTAAPTFAFTA